MSTERQCPREEMERIAEQYGTAMLRLCCVYLKDESCAEDAVQDAFLKICKSWPGFPCEAAEKAWIMRVTVNVCKDVLRSAWHRRVTLVEEYPPVETVQEYPCESRQLYQEILKLKPKYREVILLYYYQDLPIAEVAKILKLSRSAVGVRLSRARKMLQESLEQQPQLLNI